MRNVKNFTDLLISNDLVQVVETLGYKKFIVGDNNGGERYGPREGLHFVDRLKELPVLYIV